MNANTLESRVIEHCAPTLAGMKTAGLFSYFYKEKGSVIKELRHINGILNKRGVYAEALLWREESVLIYTYRFNQLKAELHDTEVMEFLSNYGYRYGSVEEGICHLKERLHICSDFPHEIGAFLGYPIKDVKGFIANEGKNCKCYGLWKVYGDEREAGRRFAKLKKCTQIYMQVFYEGRQLSQMTVVA